MLHQSNNELLEFNNSKKNQQRISQCKGYIFISCPDFSHVNRVYTFNEISNGIPLTFSLAQENLLKLSAHKKLTVYLSDHEAMRTDVQRRLKMTKGEIVSKINESLNKIKGIFYNSYLLSSVYPYESVSGAKKLVPDDYQMQLALIYWSDEGKSIQELKDRYVEKYAQMYVCMKFCKEYNLCPIFMYSKFNLNLISNIRKLLTIPVLFLEVTDPH